jgi:uncharacterized protein
MAELDTQVSESSTGPEDPPGGNGLDAVDEARARELADLLVLLSEQGVTPAPSPEVEASLQVTAEKSDTPQAKRSQAAGTRRRQAKAFDDIGDTLRPGSVEVTVSDDRLRATIGTLAPTTGLEDIARALKNEKIRHGVRVSAIKKALARARRGKSIVDLVVAEGEPPVPGEDARFVWDVSVGGQAGAILEDGTIDLRDRRLYTVVNSGDRLGHLQPARLGTEGRDVSGRKLPPADVHELEVTAGAYVELQESDEGLVVTAAAQGGVHSEERIDNRGRHRLSISIQAVSKIEGDVDYATGNVDFAGDVIIEGSVKALFEVKATGHISIEGNVEAGARIDAGGDLTVGGGVVGGDTRLRTGGKLMAKFVQGAQVYAAGDIEIGAYLFEASVKCRGSVTVAGMGEGSGRALVGGLIWSCTGIQAPSLGSPSNPKIRLIMGIDPDQVQRAEAIRTRLRQGDEQEKEILEALGVSRFDPRKLAAVLKKLPTTQRAQAVQKVHRLTRWVETREALEKKLARISQRQSEYGKVAKLVVEGPIFAGVDLRIADQSLKITEDLTSSCFQLEEADGSTSISRVDA